MNVIKAIFGKVGKFNAFNGVFVPTFLSVIGVILYLRLGVIVGSIGILGTLAIILLAASVSVATGLALSSIVTTLRIGAGGAYSIVSKTLGLEVGGSVGIPLALAQTLSVVFYILGFSEVWTFIFPDHPIKLVAVGILATIFLLTIIRASIAVKAQIFVFLLIVLSLISIFMGGGAWWANAADTSLIRQESAMPFWAAFALFFPAVTGLMAGIGLSGDLSDPKRQIPKGVLWAIGITTVIYLAATFWFGFTSTPEELVNNNLLIVEKAFYGPIILAGILAATFSSGLTTFVAAPRLMQALGNANILPFSKFFAATTKSGEPRHATFFTTTIIFIAILVGNLDTIAPLLTMFFLITYGILNIAVYIEMALGLVSFRPTIHIPKFIPLYGFLAAIIFMFLINLIFGFIALIFLFSVYSILIMKQIETKEGDVRSGLFRGIAEWASQIVLRLPESTKHIWKPNILIPVVITRTLLGNFPLIKAMAFPNGTMTVLGVKLRKEEKVPDSDDLTVEEIKGELEELPPLVKKFGEEGIFTSSSIIDVEDYVGGIITSLEAIESQIFHPNILFLPFRVERLSQTSLQKIFTAAKEHKVGVVIIDRDKELGLGSEEDIHVWLDPRAMDLDFYDDTRNFDLAVLIAYKLQRNWDGKITLWMCVPEDQKRKAEYYLRKLIYEARLPVNTKINAVAGGFKTTLRNAPQGDVHIVSVTDEGVKFIHETAKDIDKSFLFISDSGKEDILA